MSTSGPGPAAGEELLASPAPRQRLGGAAARGSLATGALKAASVLVPYLMLGILVAVYASLQEDVFSLEELNINAAATLTLVLVATGQTIVILTGGIDLSVGGLVSVATALAATRFGEGGSDMLVWGLAILGLGFAGGMVNGVLVAVIRLQPFIVTLATWSIWSGVALWVLPTEGGTIPDSLITFAEGSRLGVATPVWILLALVLFWLWFKPTRLGIGIRAVGSSEKSSYLSGVPVNRTLIGAYALSGLFAVLGGLFLTTQTAAGSPTVGNEFILTSAAAVVIGGTSLFGGRGGLIGTLAGAFILTLIGTVIFALDISSFWTPVAAGTLLILAVLVNSLTELLSRRRILG